MRKIKCYCDICEREVNADDLIMFKTQDFYRFIVHKKAFTKCDICKDCLLEIKEKIRCK